MTVVFRRLRSLLTAVAAALACATAVAQTDFSVNPLLLRLSAELRSGQLEIKNYAPQRLRIQLRGASWNQETSGKNLYGEAPGLIYFPRALDLAPGEARIVRVGIKAAPAIREESYVLFVEQVPASTDPVGNAGGAQIQLVLSIAIPVFVQPSTKPVGSAEMEGPTVRAGKLQFVLRNDANRYFRAQDIRLRGLGESGAEVMMQRLPARYVLAGNRQLFETVIPAETCTRLSALEITVTTPEKVEIKRHLDVAGTDCE
jgi:P pilus assembly chaperone PapD